MREAAFLKWQEPGEMGKNFTTLHNIFVIEKAQRGGNHNRRGGNREGGSDPPVSPALAV